MTGRFLLVLATISFAPLCALAKMPAPDIADGKYGPHDFNSFDLWKAKTPIPAPLVVYFHGGGFSGGSKASISDSLLTQLLDNGISVMAADYRLSPKAKFPDHFLDCVRAIQFARAHANEWNIDPDQVGLTGSSAGGCASLWIAFHEDLADLKNDDPIFRQSSRVRCAAVFSAQSSLDPNVVGEWVGDSAKLYLLAKAAPFLGIQPTEIDSPKARRLYQAASPITYLTKDDPPVWAFYSESQMPLAKDASASQAIHHIKFGLRLQEEMDRLGTECVIVRPDEPKVSTSAVQFFKRNFRAE